MEPWKIYLIVMVITISLSFCVCLGLMIKCIKEDRK